MNRKFEANRIEHIEINSIIAEVADRLKDTNNKLTILNHQVGKHEKQISRLRMSAV